MKVFNDIIDAQNIPDPVVTIGSYDGVHVAHQKILNHLNEEAKKINGQSILITFSPHPRYIINPNSDIKLLSLDHEKIRLLTDHGLDNVIVQNFSKEFAQLSAEEFIDLLANKIGAKKVVIGFDHRFGAGRKGNFDLLKTAGDKMGFEVEAIPQHVVSDVGVSSSKIRENLAEGKVKETIDLLGRPYALSGYVVKGQQLGQTISFPTANISIPSNKKLIPKNGSYAVMIQYKDQVYKGMLNIGNKPSLENADFSIEVNIFDFNKSIYDEELTVFFMDRLREEQKFESIEALKEQLKKDKIQSESILENVNLIF